MDAGKREKENRKGCGESGERMVLRERWRKGYGDGRVM